MHEGEFVRQLRQVTPSVHDLVSRGLSAELASEVIRGYSIHPKSRIVASGMQDPLVRLIENYDLSNFHLADVTFPKEVECGRWGCVVGHYAGDDLVRRASDGSVFLMELGTTGHALYECAESGDKFLDALLRSAQFFGRSLASDQLEARRMVRECTALAGGERYARFYNSLIGCSSLELN
ncbi:hypothetical protein Deipe_1731 [Deinococcus peraridilitoris DSM 19664]|uniref:SUKH-4 immunity protein n=2 Tax=Deinococcus TaxID=1298 RepID=L0A088_DEIPD|nr:hypothetical protein Deipe_1731 [Deinococcus peraridilitoris DSM 19664]